MTQPESILIIGAGQAGGCAAAALRREGYAGRIVLAGAEPHRPYERPPLSKAVLHDPQAEHAVFLHKPQLHEGLGLDWRPDTGISRLDVAGRVAHTAAGDALRFERCLIATGGRARLLAGIAPDAPNVHYLRGLDDARRLRDRMRPGARVMVIGAGFLGLEFAGAARAAGMEVTVCEAAGQVLGRAAPAGFAAWLQGCHEDAGAAIITGAAIEAVQARQDGVTVALADGQRLHADFLLASIGQLPNVELAQQAGLAIDNGIAVDSRCATSAPDIYAAGDCASHVSRFLGGRVRLESWQNAQEQAQVAARAMLGLPAEYDVVPWFWSDQLGMNIQMLGMPAPGMDLVLRGRFSDRKFLLFGFCGARLRYVLAVNSGADIAPLRKLLAAGKTADAGLLADPGRPVRETVKAALA